MTPNTTVTLYATPFDISNKYVIKAESPGEALGIVSAYPSKVYTDCYWQRGNDFVFRANGNINEVEQYNYCVFLNNGRYNFAFITQCDYVNDAMTLVHLAIDPWLNYAGQYIFHDSPMVRAHPSNDNAPQGFYTQEPITCNERPRIEQESGGHFTDDLPVLYIMTGVRAQDINLDTTVTDYWDGVLDLTKEISVQRLIDWSKNMKPHYTNAGNVLQPNTCVGDALLISGIVASFLQNGMDNMLIGAYHVPHYFNPNQGAAIDADLIEGKYTTFEISTALTTTAHKWRKMKVSPQFRKLILNAAGNTREIPFEYLAAMSTTESPVTIRIDINPSYNGFFTLKVANLGDVMDNFMVQSPPWDRVPLLAFGVQNTVFQRYFAKTASRAAGGLWDVIGNAVKGFAAGGAAGAIAAGVGSLAGEAGNFLLNQPSENIGVKDEVLGSGAVVGGAAGSMTVYNQSAPIFMATIYSPSNGDCIRIAKMFGTYGYMMDGEIVPITLTGLPYWKYYQTVDAAIEGRQVPQRYLSQIISRFNSGIFIFTDTSSYKDFSKAADNHY